MKRILLASLTLLSPLLAEQKIESAQITAEVPKPISLFNGKDLTGWKKVGGNGNFKVENGAIVGYGTNVDDNTFLRTKKTYSDFTLTFEFKFDDLTGNSGIMFRAEQKPGENGRVFGYQCEADNKKRAWTAGLFDEKRRRWLFPKKESPLHADHREWFTTQGNTIFKWTDWNTIKIRCKGNHIQTWLNGVKRTDFIDTDKEHDTRSGFFGLQVHKGESCNARWRNLVLTPIK